MAINSMVARKLIRSSISDNKMIGNLVIARFSSSIPSVPSNSEVLTYSYKICPYCCKAKALLHFFETKYSDVEVSPLTKKQISWSKDYKKVPIAIFADGKVVCDSTAIIEEILKRNNDSNKIDKLEFVSSSARFWEQWSTDKLAILMYPNMTRSFGECRELLSYFSEVKGIGMVEAFFVQNIGALGMTFAHGKIKKKYGLTDEREALWEALDEFILKLESDHKGEKYLGGDSPNLGDVSIYGVLCAADGLMLFNDMVARNERLASWMKDMSEVMPKPAMMS